MNIQRIGIQVAMRFFLSGLFILIVCDACWAFQVQYGARLDSLSDVSYPESPMIIDVTKPPYNAKGDGIQDDTAAIQRALTDSMGMHKMLYFPNGTYLVSDTLNGLRRTLRGEMRGVRISCVAKTLTRPLFA